MNFLDRRAFWLNLAGACLVAIVAAMPILMSNVMQTGFTLAKQALVEPLAVLAAGAALLCLDAKWITRQGRATKIAAGSLGVFLLLAVVSTVLSENPAVAIFGGSYRREGLLAWGAYGAVFLATLGWASRTRQVAGFLDVLLLSSVVASIYALQQRLELDFYPLGMRDFSRPSSTLGSPLFLAAYLAILLPVTAARCWQARRVLFQLAPWLIVGGLQVCGILVTQSRGPLLAAIFGLLLLAGCHAGRAHARRAFVSTFVAFALFIASVVAVNTIDVVRQRAQDIPVVARLVFSLDRDAGGQTHRASRSAASRLALWRTGIETFSAAPLANKMLGYGPESAYEHYYPHVPEPLTRLVGRETIHVYDRMHADTLDIGLNFGLVAWLAYCLFYGAVMYAAARALWRLSGNAPPWIFLVFTFVGGAFSAGAAIQAGLAVAAVPAFGLGMGGGWLLFMICCAWRASGDNAPAASAGQTDRWTLLAGLTSSLLIFWLDAQISIPVTTTRMISFSIAALVLLVADDITRRAEGGADCGSVSRSGLLAWGACCVLIAVCASWIPTVLFDAGMGMEETHWLRRTIPPALFLFVAACVAWADARRESGVGDRFERARLVAVVAGLPIIYVCGHLALMVRPGTELSLNHAWSISMASFAGTIFIFATCIALAWLAGGKVAAAAHAPVISRAARWSIGAVAASALLMAGLHWRSTQADVAATLASRVPIQQSKLSARLREESIRLWPYERQYRRQLILELLESVVTDIRELDSTRQSPVQISARIDSIVSNLAAAESAARAAVLRFPADPWVIVALANVLQIEALRALRPLDPDGGRRAAEEANQLYARTHQLFPAEPEFLRNWAQLAADQGNTREAYRLLDIMENLIPDDPEPYSTRIYIARQVSDEKTVSQTLARARGALDPELFNQLLSVAKVQQR